MHNSELDTAGNVRVEEASPVATWPRTVSSVIDNAAPSVEAAALFGWSEVEMTRCARVHNRGLRAAWEREVPQDDDADEPRPFVYVVWAPPHREEGALEAALEHGFPPMCALPAANLYCCSTSTPGVRVCLADPRIVALTHREMRIGCC